LLIAAFGLSTTACSPRRASKAPASVSSLSPEPKAAPATKPPSRTEIPARIKASPETRSAVAWLEKSRWAHEHLPFEGQELIVTWADGRSDSAMVRRSHDGAFERSDYVAPKNLAGHVYLTDQATTRIYNPTARRVVISPKKPHGPMNLSLLLRNYRVVLEPKPRYVADSLCRIVDLQPEDHGKPYHRLWLEKKTALILKQEHFHSDGSPSGLTQFTEIRIGHAIPASRFKLDLPPDARIVRNAPQRTGAAGLMPRTPPRLPAGYELQECRASPAGDGWHCIYSDGMDLLSVFVLHAERRDRLPSGEPVRIHGHDGILRVQSHQLIATWNDDKFRWALIGNVSRSLGLKIARAVASD
jgi:negative regulator of sigma E activity